MKQLVSFALGAIAATLLTISLRQAPEPPVAPPAPAIPRIEPSTPTPAPTTVETPPIALPPRKPPSKRPAVRPPEPEPEPVIMATAPSPEREPSPEPPPTPPPPVAPPPAAEDVAKTQLLKPDALTEQRARANRKPETVTIPVGTILQARINQTLSTERHFEGDVFSATLDEPLVVNGLVIAERGARVDGQVIQADKGGRVRGQAVLSIRLTTLHTADRQRIAILSDEFRREAGSSVGRDAARAGVGAGIGAALGAIFGGGRGAGIGAAGGAAAGGSTILFTRGRPAEIDVETRIPFRLREPVAVTERLN